MVGLPLYLATATFTRHTLAALYADLRLELRRADVHPRSAGLNLPPLPGLAPPSPNPESERTEPAGRGERKLAVTLAVTGRSRVTGAEARWDMYVPLPPPFFLPFFCW